MTDVIQRRQRLVEVSELQLVGNPEEVVVQLLASTTWSKRVPVLRELFAVEEFLLLKDCDEQRLQSMLVRWLNGEPLWDWEAKDAAYSCC